MRERGKKRIKNYKIVQFLALFRAKKNQTEINKVKTTTTRFKLNYYVKKKKKKIQWEREKILLVSNFFLLLFSFRRIKIFMFIN